MQLRTYTGLWNVERRLYKFYDMNLPYPVSVKQLGILAGSSFPWFGFLALIHFPFSSPWHVVWILPPLGVMVYANRPVAEGKTLTDFVASQIRFFLSPKQYGALKPSAGEPLSVRLRGTAWRHDPD